MAATPPTPITAQFVFNYPLSPNVNDYRSVINAAGTAVIFERSVMNSSGGFGNPQLYLLDLKQSGATPSSFIKDQEIEISNRPNWCWRTGDVAFNFDTDLRVGVVDSTGGNFRSLGAQTAKMNYPTWFPEGKTLAVENYAASSQSNTAPLAPLPNTTTIDAKTGTIIGQALEGANLFAGMPSANPAKPHLIVFAGQPVGSPYDEDTNYIWVKDISSSDPAVPLEYNAPRTGGYCPAFQGRAPWWSPDGKWVVFESNRGCLPGSVFKGGMYAIYLYEYGANTPALEITDWAYDCNHAKWIPDGFPEGPAGPFRLIVAAWQNGASSTPSGPYGLAELDLKPLGITF